MPWKCQNIPRKCSKKLSTHTSFIIYQSTPWKCRIIPGKCQNISKKVWKYVKSKGVSFFAKRYENMSTNFQNITRKCQSVQQIVKIHKIISKHTVEVSSCRRRLSNYANKCENMPTKIKLIRKPLNYIKESSKYMKKCPWIVKVQNIYGHSKLCHENIKKTIKAGLETVKLYHKIFKKIQICLENIKKIFHHFLNTLYIKPWT